MSEPRTNAPSQRAHRWLLRAMAIVLSLVVTELGFRGFLLVRGSGYSAEGSEKAMRKILTGMRQELPRSEEGAGSVQIDDRGIGRMLHPFIGFETLRGQHALDQEFQRFLKQGPRADRAQIWIVGGSVAAIFAEPDKGGQTLVQRLESAGVFGDRKPVLHNFARASFKQPQQLAFVAYLLSLGLSPAVLINLDGFNEAAIGYRNATIASNPVYPSITQWGNLAVDRTSDPELAALKFEMTLAERDAVELVDRTLSRGLHHSALLGWLTRRRLESLRARRASLQTDVATALADRKDDPSLRGAGAPALAEHAADIIVRNWVESSRSLNALAKSREFFYLHVLQPTLHDEGSKPLTETEQREGAKVRPEWVQGVQLCYPRFKAAADELASHGIEFYDATAVFADANEDLYYDPCHFNVAGNRILAERIADDLIARMKP